MYINHPHHHSWGFRRWCGSQGTPFTVLGLLHSLCSPKVGIAAADVGVLWGGCALHHLLLPLGEQGCCLSPCPCVAQSPALSILENRWFLQYQGTGSALTISAKFKDRSFGTGNHWRLCLTKGPFCGCFLLNQWITLIQISLNAVYHHIHFLWTLQSYFCSLCLNSCEGVCCHKVCHFSLCTFALIQWDPGSIWSLHQTLYKYQKTQGLISEIICVNIFWKCALQSQIYHSLINRISLGFEEVTKVLYLKFQQLFPFWLK